MKTLIAAATLLGAGWMALCYMGAALTLSPSRAEFEDRETIAERPVENVTIATEDGLKLSAWLLRGDKPDRAVIFLAGITSDRRQGVSRAEYFLSLGYTVLLPDLRATGKSEGDLVSIGWHERKDLAACYRYLRDLGYQHVGADGISLGAATICYAVDEVPDFAFVILESSYDTIESAFNNRMDLFLIPHILGAPVRWFAERRIGATAEQMRPVDFMTRCKAPALIMSGDAEGFLKVSETQSLYDNCASEIKRICIFEGGHHENFLRRFPDQYKATVEDFLADVEATWQDNAMKEAA
ncbi:MAG TPA: CocE/NonD family hydrolase [Candidatus Hydrogenedentes bacterium]|nr:CocE/NonD family hydrolase [Candidatus Hydrogenedentota bacterium]HPG69198.1 CocE/NonD family hydrolase [Candidatus Hydrogenedentota bacterium]